MIAGEDDGQDIGLVLAQAMILPIDPGQFEIRRLATDGQWSGSLGRKDHTRQHGG
jgi:hypothetical protein